MPGDSPSCYLSSCHWLCSDAHHLLSRLLQWYFHWTFFLSACPVLWLIASLVPTLHISVIESFIHLIMALWWMAPDVGLVMWLPLTSEMFTSVMWAEAWNTLVQLGLPSCTSAITTRRKCFGQLPVQGGWEIHGAYLDPPHCLEPSPANPNQGQAYVAKIQVQKWEINTYCCMTLWFWSVCYLAKAD